MSRSILLWENVLTKKWVIIETSILVAIDLKLVHFNVGTQLSQVCRTDFSHQLNRFQNLSYQMQRKQTDLIVWRLEQTQHYFSNFFCTAALAMSVSIRRTFS